MSNRLGELSCDEAVARELDPEAKKEYGGTLLRAVSEEAEYQRSVLTNTLCEDKKSLKERLSAILKAERKSKKMIVLSVAVAVVLGGAAVCFLLPSIMIFKYINHYISSGYNGRFDIFFLCDTIKKRLSSLRYLWVLK
jgi:hypothetical protein